MSVVDRIQPAQPSLLRVELRCEWADGSVTEELSEPGRAAYLVNRYTKAAGREVVITALP